jgi:hypothetical protein
MNMQTRQINVQRWTIISHKPFDVVVAAVEGRPKMVRLIVGNPLIMQSMARLVPDAGSYAPVTVLIDQRPDGVYLSYDEMASFLSPYGSAEALIIARDLDAKVKRLLENAS